jgi:hypothetical protein
MKSIVLSIAIAAITSAALFAQNIKGSDTCLPLSQKAAEEFMKSRSGASVTVTGGGIRVPYPVEVVKEVKKPLTGWQNFQVWCGRIALVVGLFGIVYFVRKLKKKRLF